MPAHVHIHRKRLKTLGGKEKKTETNLGELRVGSRNKPRWMYARIRARTHTRIHISLFLRSLHLLMYVRKEAKASTTLIFVLP